MNRARERAVVTLLPRADLHTGIHGALLANPPPEVDYRVHWGTHVFERFGTGMRTYSPWEELAAFEAVDASGSRGIVHSVRWPVLARGAWVVEMDDWGYPCLLGRAVWNPTLREKYADGDDAALRRRIRTRAARMLHAYQHASCAAILTCTHKAIETAAELLVMLRLEREGEATLRKMRVLHPSERAVPRAVVVRKWREPPLRVIFVGRDFVAKNGAVALDVFDAVSRAFPTARFCYVGPIPNERPRTALLRHNVDHYDAMPRSQLLGMMSRAHVLFHPARHESFGMVFSEAAATGMAIVATGDGDMSHVREFLDARSAYLVNRGGLTPHAERARFARVLAHVLRATDEARSKALQAHAIASHGVLSQMHRDRVLHEAYERAVAARARPLTLAELCNDGVGSLARIQGRHVPTAAARHFRRIGETRSAILF